MINDFDLVGQGTNIFFNRTEEEYDHWALSVLNITLITSSVCFSLVSSIYVDGYSLRSGFHVF